jgi:prepilin-type N-terminal cleavage/methylation domain-containing protein
MKKRAFTLIELLVVIVIIGILATIGIAQFNQYFARARDVERMMFVRNASLLLKTLHAEGKYENYWFHNASFDGGTDATIHQRFQGILNDHGYGIPEPKGDLCYIYAASRSTDNYQNFFIAVESESNPGTFFIDGTTDAKTVTNNNGGSGLTAALTVTTDSCASQGGLSENAIIYSPTGIPYGALLLIRENLY